MEIKERKIRKSGNSLSITLSKEFLIANGLSENDTVFVDEDKLKEAITKKEIKPDDELRIDMLIQQSMTEYRELYQELVDK